ncbi:MAG TPA: hypothetical protein VGK74_27895 [Symbiobacteriaceae bacterium]|jgi:hypothetical protein
MLGATGKSVFAWARKSTAPFLSWRLGAASGAGVGSSAARAGCMCIANIIAVNTESATARLIFIQAFLYAIPIGERRLEPTHPNYISYIVAHISQYSQVDAANFQIGEFFPRFQAAASGIDMTREVTGNER